VPRQAGIDIGTNSVRLLVAEVPDPPLRSSPHRIRPILRRLTITRLGERLAGAGVIQPEAASRTAAVVAEFAGLALAAGVRAPIVVGTHALRAARNPEELLTRLRLPVRVLSGEDEARLGYLGVLAGLNTPRSVARMLVVDIGGGSVELTRGRGRQIDDSVSLPVGAVVLTERFLLHDPPLLTEITAAGEALARTLGPYLHRAGGRPPRVIGTGGTITTMAALAQRLVPYDPDRVHGYRLTHRAVEAIAGALRVQTVAERRRLPGLQPERADIILAGALILQHLMGSLGCRQLTVSEADLLWAVVLDPTLSGITPDRIR
jgi:exopolyphosphatase/guanosine-5'-triphosphate,3'-diphosphate pyrophosphatase